MGLKTSLLGPFTSALDCDDCLDPFLYTEAVNKLNYYRGRGPMPIRRGKDIAFPVSCPA